MVVVPADEVVRADVEDDADADADAVVATESETGVEEVQ